MKKVFSALFLFVLSVAVYSKTFKVAVTPVPHTAFLELIKEDLKKEGIDLEIVEFNDYVVPNIALAEKEVDANYFQHVPYLKKFSEERKLKLTSLGTVHIAPLALYSNKYKSVNDLPKGATVAIPNDPSNLGRSLILLHLNGVIKLKNPNDWFATEFDVAENPKKLKFKLVEAPQLPRVLKDVDSAIIPGNFAIQNGLNPVKNGLVREDEKSPYANVVAVRTGDENREDVKKFFKILRSEKLKKFINEKYDGGVIATY